jgi:hypothetical protein
MPDRVFESIEPVPLEKYAAVVRVLSGGDFKGVRYRQFTNLHR